MPRKKRRAAAVPKGSNFAADVRKVVLGMSETKSRISTQTEQVHDTMNAPNFTYRLNDTVRGSGAHERIGDSVTGQMMDVRGSVFCAHNLPVVHKIIAVECSKDSDPTQDMFETDFGTFGPASGDLKDVYARIDTTKYKVLATRQFITGNSTNASIHATTQVAKLFSMNFKTPGVYHYDQSSGEHKPQDRVIRLMSIARLLNNDDSGSGLTYELTFNSKWYFKDI